MPNSASNAVTVSFIVPCYNERGNIGPTIKEIEQAVGDVGISEYEILVVDDCSRDGTGDVVAALMPQNTHIQLIRNARNLGFGGAYKEGVRHATETYVIMIPGDNSYPADGIAAILREAGSVDIIVPYRKDGDARPWYRSGASVTFTRLINLLFGLNLPYYNGPVLHRTDQLKSIEIKTDGFAYGAEALVKLLKRGASYKPVGITIEERDEGRSSALKLKTIYGVVKAIAALRLSHFDR